MPYAVSEIGGAGINAHREVQHEECHARFNNHHDPQHADLNSLDRSDIELGAEISILVRYFILRNYNCLR